MAETKAPPDRANRKCSLEPATTAHSDEGGGNRGVGKNKVERRGTH